MMALRWREYENAILKSNYKQAKEAHGDRDIPVVTRK